MAAPTNTEFRPTICLTDAALASALGQSVEALTFNGEAFDAVRQIGGAGTEAIPDLTIAFGGLVKRGRAIRFDPNQTYNIVQEPDGTLHRLTGQNLPAFDPASRPDTLLLNIPIPERWTTPELGASLLRAVNTDPSPVKVAAALNTAGAAIGLIAGRAFYAELGTNPKAAAVLGLAGGLTLSGAATVLAGPFFAMRFGGRQQRARREGPLRVHYQLGRHPGVHSPGQST
jgi:hypothetical protein